MQSLLSFLVDTIALTSFVYFAIGFVLTVRSTSPRAKIEMVEEASELIDVTAIAVSLEQDAIVSLQCPIAGMSRDQLRLIAKSRGVARWARMSKAELVAAIV
jgi:hypothetical protein